MPRITPPGGPSPLPRGFGSAWDLTIVDIPGVGRTTCLLPIVPEDASPEVREGIARRRLVMLTGHCPCGAVRTLPNRATRRSAKGNNGSSLLNAVIEHEPDCCATDSRLRALGWHW